MIWNNFKNMIYYLSMKKDNQKKEQKQKGKTKPKPQQDIKNFKQKYFDFYDDIKDYTNGKEDW